MFFFVFVAFAIIAIFNSNFNFKYLFQLVLSFFNGSWTFFQSAPMVVFSICNSIVCSKNQYCWQLYWFPIMRLLHLTFIYHDIFCNLCKENSGWSRYAHLLGLSAAQEVIPVICNMPCCHIAIFSKIVHT